MNIIKGIAGALILLLGVRVIIGFTSGFFDESFPWVIIAIVGIIVVIVISGILVLPRARIEKLSRTHEFRTD
ncbi:MAG: hypothetical protein GPJ51_05455 [Candidatus Heimdallarchaeota archaeon]|nr:hypothetical protein [Candidatus Heimdallarchaeota archaeon]